MNQQEALWGTALLVCILILGGLFLESSLFFRLLIGLGLGYALSRAALGFAGSVNRAFRAGSTRLMRTLMVMFCLTALTSTAFLYQQDPTRMNLWINPINIGLIVGGLMFGFGMSIASCCASGVLTYFSSNLTRPAITLLFFGMGVFLGFPLQAQQSWIRDSWISTATYEGRGVFMPDLFAGDPLNGYLGALLLTLCLAALISWLALRYERYRRDRGTYIGVASEQEQLSTPSTDLAQHRLFSQATYESLFVKRWSPVTGAAVIAILFTLLMGVTGAGWGASSPFGFWFGRLLIALSLMDPAQVAAFTHRPEQVFTMPFFSHPVNVQNIGIMLGAMIALLLAGRFGTGLSRLRLSGREAVLLMVAGLSMGLGTRLANGCNVGALFTPIANFSLSGWIFLVVMVLGGILGNQLQHRLHNA